MCKKIATLVLVVIDEVIRVLSAIVATLMFEFGFRKIKIRSKFVISSSKVCITCSHHRF
jgi:hypothetical protein